MRRLRALLGQPPVEALLRARETVRVGLLGGPWAPPIGHSALWLSASPRDSSRRRRLPRPLLPRPRPPALPPLGRPFALNSPLPPSFPRSFDDIVRAKNVRLAATTGESERKQVRGRNGFRAAKPALFPASPHERRPPPAQTHFAGRGRLRRPPHGRPPPPHERRQRLRQGPLRRRRPRPPPTRRRGTRPPQLAERSCGPKGPGPPLPLASPTARDGRDLLRGLRRPCWPGAAVAAAGARGGGALLPRRWGSRSPGRSTS